MEPQFEFKNTLLKGTPVETLICGRRLHDPIQIEGRDTREVLEDVVAFISDQMNRIAAYNGVRIELCCHLINNHDGEPALVTGYLKEPTQCDKDYVMQERKQEIQSW